MRKSRVAVMRGLVPVVVASSVPMTTAQAKPPALPLAGLDDIDSKVCHLAAHTDVDIEIGLAQYLTRDLILPNGDHLHVSSANENLDYIEANDEKGAVIDLAYPETGSDQSDSDGPIDKGVRLLPFMGRAYVMNYSGSQPLYLHEIDRINPNRSVTQICRFRPNVIVSLIQAEKASDAPLCDRVEKGRVHVVKDHAIHGRRPMTNAFVEDTASVRVDFQNIGRPQTVIRTEASSEFGPDCQSSLLTMGGKASRREAKLLEKLQDKSSKKKYVPGMLTAGCADEPARWITDHKKTYLEMRSHNYNHPTTEDSEYWFVSIVEKGRARRVCEAFYMRNPPALVSIWNGGDWTPASIGDT